jgi:hypothetical protein
MIGELRCGSLLSRSGIGRHSGISNATAVTGGFLIVERIDHQRA